MFGETELVKLKSCEGDLFEVEPAAACMSVLIKSMLSFDEEIPLPNVKTAILSKVLDYCRHCAVSGDPPAEIKKPLRSTDLIECGASEWDNAYLNIEQEMLRELVLAANYLNVKSLEDLTCAKVASSVLRHGPIVLVQSGGTSRWRQPRYEPLERIARGASVFLARDRDTNDTVALKRLNVDEDEGVPATVVREMSLSQDFVHPNVVQLKDIQVTGTVDHLPFEYQLISEFVPGHVLKPRYDLIFEYVPVDLSCILKGHRREGTKMPMAQVLGYSQDLLRGIFACHVRLIMHRNLKPNNLLIHPVDGLKICDFELARAFSLPHRAYTQEVVSLWYRGPELLLGHPRYGQEVDLWSAGCVLAEMATSYPTFPGDSEIGTIFLILEMLGSPTEATWPGFEQSLAHWSSRFPRWSPTDLRPIRQRRPELGEAEMDLLTGLLAMNPASRLSARRAKAHAVFSRQEGAEKSEGAYDGAACARPSR